MPTCRYCNKFVKSGIYLHEKYCSKNPDCGIYKKPDCFYTAERRDVWYFWNHCFLGRTAMYNPRMLKKEDRPVRNTHACPKCGKITSAFHYTKDYLFNWYEFIKGAETISTFLYKNYNIHLFQPEIEISNDRTCIIFDSQTLTRIELTLIPTRKDMDLILTMNGEVIEELKAYVINRRFIQIYRLIDLCYSCHGNIKTEELCGERKEKRKKSIELAGEFADLLNECEKKGTCDVLAAHHKLLIDDDNRLETNLLVGLVCKADYEDRWEEIVAKNELAYKDWRERKDWGWRKATPESVKKETGSQ